MSHVLAGLLQGLRLLVAALLLPVSNLQHPLDKPECDAPRRTGVHRFIRVAGGIAGRVRVPLPSLTFTLPTLDPLCPVLPLPSTLSTLYPSFVSGFVHSQCLLEAWKVNHTHLGSAS